MRATLYKIRRRLLSAASARKYQRTLKRKSAQVCIKTNEVCHKGGHWGGHEWARHYYNLRIFFVLHFQDLSCCQGETARVPPSKRRIHLASFVATDGTRSGQLFGILGPWCVLPSSQLSCLIVAFPKQHGPSGLGVLASCSRTREQSGL